MMYKRLLAFMLALFLCFCMAISAATGKDVEKIQSEVAHDEEILGTHLNRIIYCENFDNVKNFDELGWKRIESFKTATAHITIENGKLLIDNLKDKDRNPKPKDSYYIVVPQHIMADVVISDYTVQWDMIYLDSGDADRYLTLLLNYDRQMGDSYISFHYRPKGTANFQARCWGDWIDLDTTGSTEGGISRPNCRTHGEDAISKYIWGIDYIDEETSVTLNKPITVRVEYHNGKCIKVFMNDKFVTATDNRGWKTASTLNVLYSEIAMKVGSTIKAYMDNIVVVAGIGIPTDVWTTDSSKVETTARTPVTTVRMFETTIPVTTVRAPETTRARVTTVRMPETTRTPVTTVRAPETTRTPVTTVRVPETTRTPVTTVRVPETTCTPATTVRVPETTAPVPVAPAPAPGTPMGDVLYTDILAYIDDKPIRSYNIAGNTYIVVEDLTAYGFDVQWIAEGSGKLVVGTTRTAAPDGYTANYVPEKNTKPAGTVAMQYLYTNITAWLGDKQVTGYNIGGLTCIGMDDLAAVFAVDYVWDGVEGALRLYTQP